MIVISVGDGVEPTGGWTGAGEGTGAVGEEGTAPESKRSICSLERKSENKRS